jgi:hypothetical protein
MSSEAPNGGECRQMKALKTINAATDKGEYHDYDQNDR